jgi:hypothetical protein
MYRRIWVPGEMEEKTIGSPMMQILDMQIHNMQIAQTIVFSVLKGQYRQSWPAIQFQGIVLCSSTELSRYGANVQGMGSIPAASVISIHSLPLPLFSEISWTHSNLR